MITRPTVLVLGAGASQPYGFPTAYELLELVHRTAEDETALRPVLSASGFTDDDIRTFCRRQKWSGQYSIDAFVEREPSYLSIGKAAIAFQLLLPEWNLLAGDYTVSVDWLRYLFSGMVPKTPREFGANRLTVITFNFDHSFEWYLTRTLRATYGLSQQEATQLAGTIRVLHVHGELASDRPSVERERNRRENHPTADEVMACVPKIRLGHEVTMSPEVFLARQLLAEAEFVHFLGFSFIKDNLDKLEAITLGSKALYGTRRGMSDAERDRAYAYFNSARTNYLFDCEVRAFFNAVDVFRR